MDKPLGQHINELHRRIQDLGHELMNDHKTQIERNHIEAELRVAQQALEHFQKAIKLEERLRERG
jgi:hypothetical protein